MRTLFASESCKETPLNTINPQSWLQVERGKLSKSTSYAPSSIESIIKVPEPQILPFFKPIDYVQVLAQIHEELESCLPQEKSALYLLQYQIFKGLGEIKLMRRSLKSAYTKAGTVYDKIIFSSWLKYEKRGEDIIFDLLGGNNNEFPILDIASELPQNFTVKSPRSFKDTYVSKTVTFKIGDKKIKCNRQKIANLSTPFHTMLNGCFSESSSEEIDLSENNISFSGMCVIRDFSINGTLNEVSPTLLLEILIFANKYCCEGLKDACDRKLSRLVSSKEDAIELMECALEETCPVLAASCLQVFLTELPDSLTDNQVVELLTTVNKHKKLTMVGSSTFSLYCLLSEVSLNLNPMSDKTVLFLKNLVEASETSQQKMMSYHQLGYVLYLRKEYEEAQKLFESAFNEGHVYSIVGLSRLNENSQWAYEKLTAVISNNTPLGWMYQERSLYGSDDSDLETATQLDPTLTYPYMYRAASLMKKHNHEGALSEINRVLGFKLALECLELRFCFYLAIEDYKAALCDIQAILTLSPDYRMFDNKVAATQLRTLVREHVENWTTADCWLQLYDTWSSVDDIGSLSVIYQMLESDSAKGVLYFRQSLLLLRLNSPEAAMKSLQLARKHATSEHERLVYEGWILYDTGHCEEGLKKAEESINLKRSFEAYFLKAYALADSSVDPSCSATVISLLNEALKCPSDRLRKGQALNNLGSIHVDCNELDEAADCYINALKIRHTRAHQGLARVHYLKNDKKSAYEEMTKLIEKARNNASAYEKRSEYCERDLTRADLEMVTKLDPLRVYPYRYRAAVLMDNHNAEEAIGVLSKAIAFKADLHLLHLRAAFYEYTGNVSGALRDCRAALSVDPNHQEMLELHSRVNSQEP